MSDAVELGETVGTLHHAACTGDKHTLKKLLENLLFEDIDVKDHLGQTSLFCSIAYNHVECASLLLKSGARADSTDNTGQTALHIAINKGFYRCVKLLLANGAIWYQKDLEGVTALHAAAVSKSARCLPAILSELKPGEIDIQDGLKKTALHWSAAYGNVDYVKQLLDKGANISIPDNEGKTPVHWVVINSNAESLHCLRTLLDSDPYVINWQDYTGRTALHLAVLSGSIQMVDILTSSKYNCDMNILDNMFCTPLHLASKEGLHEKIALLLDRGALYESGDSNGATPLHYAAYNNNSSAVARLLSRTYVKDVPDKTGRTALHWAAAGSADDVIEIMANYDIDFAVKDKRGFTALHAAAVQGNISTIKLLLKCRAPIDSRDNDGLSPLLRACEVGRLKAAHFLVNNGAFLLCTDDNTRNCLHWAAKGGHAYLCQILFQEDPHLSAGDLSGLTPLHYASLKGYINCVSVFLENGVDPNVTDKNGRTPLHMASTNDHIDIVKLLCDYNASINAMAYLKYWITPLDCAIRRENIEVANFLKSVDAVTAQEVKSIAAKKIQIWFRKVCNTRKCRDVNYRRTENPSNESLKSSENGSLLDQRFYSDSKHCDEPVILFQKCSERSKNHSQNVISNNDYSQKNQTILNTYGSQIYSLPCSNSHSTLKSPYKNITKDQAAQIIQKTWRKFFFKKIILEMRQKIYEAFPTVESRKAAEEIWSKQLEEFFNSL